MTGSGKLELDDSRDVLGGSELSCIEGSGEGEVVDIWPQDGAGAETWSTGRTTLSGSSEEHRPFKDDMS